MLRHRKKALQVVKELDAFPKTSEECIETTTTGGTFSVISFVLVVCLVIMELMYFMETTFTFTFTPDTDFTQKLKINVDITVAMPCRCFQAGDEFSGFPSGCRLPFIFNLDEPLTKDANVVGADVLDMTGQQVMTFGALDMEETWWELDSNQRVHFEGIQRVNNYLRDQFHSIHEILWRSGYTNIFGDMPRRYRTPDKDKDACRVHGILEINKVAGNFHITAGKTIPLPRGHAHLAVFMEDSDYNFTHRIHKLSFGDPAPGIVHPLEGDEQIAEKNLMSFQYFISIVPTYVNTYSHRGPSFQYSVTELAREISHEKNSHGTPGVYFKYDVSALKVEVTERHEPFLAFLTRLCGIVGGVFACSGLISTFIGLVVDCFTCRFFRSTPSKSSEADCQVTQVSATILLKADVIPDSPKIQVTDIPVTLTATSSTPSASNSVPSSPSPSLLQASHSNPNKSTL